MIARLIPLPSWTIFVPGILIVPFAFVITYALSTFITPSPIEIPIDIWSRYLLYLPGSIMAGIGFVRLWRMQRGLGEVAVGRGEHPHMGFMSCRRRPKILDPQDGARVAGSETSWALGRCSLAV